MSIDVTIEGPSSLLDNITEPRLKAADGEIEMNGLQRSIRVRHGGTTCTVLPTISSNYAICNPTKNILISIVTPALTFQL